MTTIKQLLIDASQALSAYSDSARLDAEILLQATLKIDRVYLFSHPEKEVSTPKIQQFLKLVEQRKNKLPIAYLTGNKNFWSLKLKVTSDTLVPRAETELLVEVSLEVIRQIKNPIIFDLGTGTGAIACAIAKERADAQLYASDLSPQALTVAIENAATHRLNNIKFIKSDWLIDFPKDFKADLIVSNPPYIANDCTLVEEGVARHEPALALFSPQQGYQDLLTIIQQSKYHLRPHGVLLMEHGVNQEQKLMDCLKVAHFKDIKSYPDLQKINRCISGSLS